MSAPRSSLRARSHSRTPLPSESEESSRPNVRSALARLPVRTHTMIAAFGNQAISRRACDTRSTGRTRKPQETLVPRRQPLAGGSRCSRTSWLVLMNVRVVETRSPRRALLAAEGELTLAHVTVEQSSGREMADPGWMQDASARASCSSGPPARAASGRIPMAGQLGRAGSAPNRRGIGASCCGRLLEARAARPHAGHRRQRAALNGALRGSRSRRPATAPSPGPDARDWRGLGRVAEEGAGALDRPHGRERDWSEFSALQAVAGPPRSARRSPRSA